MNQPITELEQLTLNNASKRFLKETAKWCYFLSILGFIGIALIVFASFFISSILAAMPNTSAISINVAPFIGGVYFLVGLIYFFPVYYLFKFSKKMQAALASKNDDDLASALEQLKSHYKFIGVFTIIILSIYVLAFVFGLFAAAFAV